MKKDRIEKSLKFQILSELARDLEKSFGMTDGTFKYVSPIKWWQFWKWHIRLFSKVYRKSRLQENKIIKFMSDGIRDEIDKRLRRGLGGEN